VRAPLWSLALLAGCASSAPPVEPTTIPVPAPGEPAPVVEPSEGRGREIEYSAGSARYRMDRFDTVSVQMPDGSAQRQTFRRSAWLSVDSEESGQGFAVRIALDSLDVEGMPIPPASLDSARGTSWTGQVARDGELTGVAASQESAIGGQIGSLLQLLFPPLPENSIRAGARWSDTTDKPTVADAFEVQEQAIMQYSAGNPASRRGSTVLPIVAVGTFTRTGSGVQFGRTLEMQSKGARRFTHFMGLDGRPAGLDGIETNEVTITVPEVGQSIEATQSGTIQITPIESR